MKRAVAFLVLLFPLLAVAQITFQPGYFIENGTKTECLIKNLAWKNNPTSIEYKLTENEDVKTKTIKEISEFSVNDAYKYRRYTVNVDRSGITIDKLSVRKEPEWKTETVFLKVMVEGKATLYHFEDSNFTKYFYSGTDISKTEQLVYKEYMLDGRVAENNFFRQQLYNLMKDGNSKMSDYEKLKYKKENLVSLFTNYNGSTGEKMVNLSDKQNKGSVNMKITVGASFSKLSADIGNGFNTINFDLSRKPAVRIGAEVEYVMPFNNKKWSLFIDPNYQYYKADDAVAGKYSASAEYSYIELPVGFRHYMYLNTDSKFFVGAAYNITLVLGDSFLQYNGAVVDLEKNTGASISGGYSYKKYSAELRYGFNHGITTDVNWGTQYNSLSIILGYKLF
jgi:hypothetical protein